MNRKLISSILIMALFQFCFALSSDRKQSLTIQSNQALFDSKKKIHIFTGKVIMTQGTTKVTGDKMIAYTKNNNKIKQVEIYGHLARYRTIPEAQDNELIATAELIKYFPDKQEVQLIGHAQATQNNKTIKGPKLEYYTDKQLVISPPSNKGRTTIIFPPEQASVEENA